MKATYIIERRRSIYSLTTDKRQGKRNSLEGMKVLIGIVLGIGDEFTNKKCGWSVHDPEMMKWSKPGFLIYQRFAVLARGAGRWVSLQHVNIGSRRARWDCLQQKKEHI